MKNITEITNTLYSKGISKKYAIKLEELKEGEKISIVSDIMFKAMFQTIGREKFPSRLLSYYTRYSYEELLENLVFEKNELDKVVANKKGLRCDFVGRIVNTKLNIEINNNSSLETMERNMDYGFRLYASKVKNDTDYDYVSVIQFNINNFSIKGDDKIVDVFTIQNNEGVSLTDKLIFIQIYIPNLRKKWYTSGIESLSEDEKFLLTLVETSIKSSRELGKGIDIMEEYINEAIVASKDEQILEAYDKEWALKDEGKREGFKEGFDEGYEEGKEQGYDEGITQGITQGILQNKTEIVFNMLNKGMDINLISEITGLNIEEINLLKTNNN